jgi:hypothetical protein
VAVILLVEAATPAVAAVIPLVEAVIRAAEVTTKSLAGKGVCEVKARGGKGVLNGTPFLISSGLATQRRSPRFTFQIRGCIMLNWGILRVSQRH